MTKHPLREPCWSRTSSAPLGRSSAAHRWAYGPCGPVSGLWLPDLVLQLSDGCLHIVAQQYVELVECHT